MENQQIFMMILIRGAICAAVTYAASRINAGAAVVSVALWGALMAKPIIELGANWFNWARREPYEKWQGNYYEFANVQIRIIELGTGSTQRLWFVAADILKVLGERPTKKLELVYNNAEYCVLPDENLAAFSEEGVKKYLTVSRQPQSVAMLLWIEREVIKPHRRKLEIASTPAPVSAHPPEM
jgi:hypothetical protein